MTRGMTYMRALGIVAYNYDDIYFEDDWDWLQTVIAELMEWPSRRKREACRRLNLKYPPQGYWDEWFGNRCKFSGAENDMVARSGDSRPGETPYGGVDHVIFR